VRGPSPAEDYPPAPRRETGYSDGPQYRLADQASRQAGSASGRHSTGRHGNYPGDPVPADEQYGPREPAEFDELTGDYPTWRPR
jgi:hypothetical protein